jgi:Carboxypeptidase regulatory-like domain/TonB dependent receptor-like, beta-barrel
MKTWKKSCRTGLLMALALLLALPTASLAQVRGQFSGTVVDQTGAVVVGANVSATNERTGEVRSAVTDTAGRFVIPGLQAAVYTLKASFGQFAPLEYMGMELVAGLNFQIDLALQPAGVTETVTVVAQTNTVDLSSARQGVNVNEAEVQALPVNGRQMSQLMLQAPGAQNSGTGTWQEIRFSGRAVEQNVIRYDGVEGSAIIDAAPGNLNGEVPSPFKLQASLENVQEFRVESSNFPAEFGTGTGGQVNVITKSGANQFHGSIFEYVRNDALDARNYFDSTRRDDGSVIDELPKSDLSQHQFGGSFGGPIAKNRAFFFGSYEGYKLTAGTNSIEAVPSDLAWSRAVAAIASLRPGFLHPDAVILAGKSTDPNFDIAQLQAEQKVQEHSFSARVDFRMSNNWSSYVRVFHDQGTSDQFEGVTGRKVHITANPSNAVFNLQGIMGGGLLNEFKFGYNAAPTTIVGDAPLVNGIDFGLLAINITGSIANTGIAGQGSSTGVAIPGGLVRANSATNGHASPYDPYSLTFGDTLTRVSGQHVLKAGAEARIIRMETDRIGGTTYSFANVDAFMANNASNAQYVGNLSDPSVFNDGATGPRYPEQEYFVGFIQDEWRIGPKFTTNVGLRYDYYTVLDERNSNKVMFDIDAGIIEPSTTPEYKSKKNSFQPRISANYAPTTKTVFRAGFGIFVGPGQTEDQIQPIESDVIRTTQNNVTFPVNIDLLRANFINTPNNRAYQPRAYANEYILPERIYQYTVSMQQELTGNLIATAAYVGSQGRNLFLRSVANNITGLIQTSPTATATVIREFSIVNGTNVQNPYAEVDYKTSGGHDSYNALQLSLSRRSSNGLSLNGQYTYGYSKGNTAGSNEALTAANNARAIEEFDYDDGYNNFDVRHTFNLSAIYNFPGEGGLKGGWMLGGILNARSGLPVNVLVTRNDVVYVDALGNVFNNPAVGRTAVINTPRGGSSRNVRRPNVVPGVDPYIKDGGLVFLNPAAFSTPAPGTFGDLERNSIHGPSFRQVDLVVAKKIPFGGGGPNAELRMEVFNLFNIDNFINPAGTLPNALPNNTLTEANRVQPGQPYTTGAAGTFGKMSSTLSRTVGLGTNRQIQFAFRVNF